jgi:hypothetical protein
MREGVTSGRRPVTAPISLFVLSNPNKYRVYGVVSANLENKIKFSVDNDDKYGIMIV